MTREESIKAIEKVIKLHSVSQISLMKHVDIKDVMKDIRDLAKALEDAMEVDEKKLSTIVYDTCGCGFCDTCRRIIKAITKDILIIKGE